MTAGSAPMASATVQEFVARAVDLYGIALHDLGQPLTSIALALELVALEEDAHARHTMLEAARSECARAIGDVAALRAKTLGLLQLAAPHERTTR